MIDKPSLSLSEVLDRSQIQRNQSLTKNELILYLVIWCELLFTTNHVSKSLQETQMLLVHFQKFKSIF